VSLMAYPFKKLENLSVRIQELIGDYQNETKTCIMPQHRAESTREEIFEERTRGLMEATKKFMKNAGTKILPEIQSVLAEIEVLVDSEDMSIVNRIRPILNEAQRLAMHPTNPLGYEELCAILMRLRGQLGIRVVIRPIVFVGYRYTKEDEMLAEKFIRP